MLDLSARYFCIQNPLPVEMVAIECPPLIVVVVIGFEDKEHSSYLDTAAF
jgi:hypothetical protein